MKMINTRYRTNNTIKIDAESIGIAYTPGMTKLDLVRMADRLFGTHNTKTRTRRAPRKRTHKRVIKRVLKRTCPIGVTQITKVAWVPPPPAMEHTHIAMTMSEFANSKKA